MTLSEERAVRSRQGSGCAPFDRKPSKDFKQGSIGSIQRPRSLWLLSVEETVAGAERKGEKLAQVLGGPGGEVWGEPSGSGVQCEG